MRPLSKLHNSPTFKQPFVTSDLCDLCTVAGVVLLSLRRDSHNSVSSVKWTWLKKKKKKKNKPPQHVKVLTQLVHFQLSSVQNVSVNNCTHTVSTAQQRRRSGIIFPDIKCICIHCVLCPVWISRSRNERGLRGRKGGKARMERYWMTRKDQVHPWLFKKCRKWVFLLVATHGRHYLRCQTGIRTGQSGRDASTPTFRTDSCPHIKESLLRSHYWLIDSMVP